MIFSGRDTRVVVAGLSYLFQQMQKTKKKSILLGNRYYYNNER